MRAIHFVRLALAIGAAAWLVISIKRKGMNAVAHKIIGGAVGGFLGFMIPFAFAQIYVWQGGDPTAAGVFSFFCILTVPVGIAAGVAGGNQMSKSGRPLGKDKRRNDDSASAFSVVRTVRSAVEADMFITFLRSAGLHPLDIDTSAHFSLAGAEIEFPIEVPTKELGAARELLKGYENSAPNA